MAPTSDIQDTHHRRSRGHSESAQRQPFRLVTNNTSTSKSEASPPRRSRHPQSSENVNIPRPSNCFILFRSHMCQLRRQGRVETDRSMSSHKHDAQQWRALSDAERQFWVQRAQEEKASHKLKYPNYRYTPMQRPQKQREKRGDAVVEIKREEFEAPVPQLPTTSHLTRSNKSRNKKKACIITGHLLQDTGNAHAPLSSIASSSTSHRRKLESVYEESTPTNYNTVDVVSNSEAAFLTNLTNLFTQPDVIEHLASTTAAATTNSHHAIVDQGTWGLWNFGNDLNGLSYSDTYTDQKAVLSDLWPSLEQTVYNVFGSKRGRENRPPR